MNRVIWSRAFHQLTSVHHKTHCQQNVFSILPHDINCNMLLSSACAYPMQDNIMHFSKLKGGCQPQNSPGCTCRATSNESEHSRLAQQGPQADTPEQWQPHLHTSWQKVMTMVQVVYETDRCLPLHAHSICAGTIQLS